MASAAAAIYFGAHHSVTGVVSNFDGARNRVVETRPAGATIELQLGLKQRLPAAGAVELAGALLIEQRTATRHLGAVLAHCLVLLRREQLPPLRLGACDRTLLRHYLIASGLTGEATGAV